MKLVKDKTFYKTLLALALPIALQNLISFGVNLMDTIMIGRLGEAEISAVSIANQPFFVFTLIIYGLAGGASVLCAQYWGKNNIQAIKKIMSIAVRFSVCASLLFTALVLLIPYQLMGLYSNDPAVIELAVQYLKLVSISYCLFSISSAYINIMRSVENVKISMIVYTSSFFVNVFFNWIFIFGKLGAPTMGVRGAAVGTILARATELLMVLIYSSKIEKTVGFRLWHLFKRDKLLTKDFMRYSAPVVCNEFFWSLGTSVNIALLGQLGTQALAANSISTVVGQIVTVLLFGVANAAAVIVGKQIGLGKAEYAKSCGNTLLIISISLGVVLMCALLAVKSLALSVYDITDQAKDLTNSFLIISAVIIVFQSFTVTAIIGVFRGGGDTRFGFFADMIMIWGYAIPAAALAIFVFHAPAVIVFFIIKSEEIIKCILCFARLKSQKWLRSVARDQL